MRQVPVILLAFALLAAFVGGATADSHRVPLSYDVPDLTRVGALEWRGGIELSDDDPRFGGLSALDVDADGRTLTVLTDRGDWLRLALDYDERGHLAGARIQSLTALIGSNGQPFDRKSERDAESLAQMPDGSYAVSFEARHRLLHYPAAEPPFSNPPRTLTPPTGLRGATGNGGIEAMTSLAGHLLFAVSEKLRLTDGTLLAWVGDGRRWKPLRYRPTGAFRPTGATTLPDGEVLLLERRFSALGGFAARLVRLSPEAIERAARDFNVELQGIEVARLEPPHNVDNFEGIAARRGENGETLVYLVSDDNFFALQHTLLMMFVLHDTGPDGAPHS